MSGMDTRPYQEWARENLGFEFDDIDLLLTALTHRSYVNEHKKSARTHNERLEFLGDAVLELAATRFLYLNHDEPEGILTSWRSSLVRTESIGAAGQALGYAPLIRMSRGEKQGSDRARAQILANAFEALIGAIYLDKGYDTAEAFIAKHILVKLDEILESGSWRDPKSHLQEVSQRIDGQTPVYKVLEEDGPDHDKTFVIGAFVADNLKGRGQGSSKHAAQQEAAKMALATYRRETKRRKK
jgi:ribonuclease-3